MAKFPRAEADILALADAIVAGLTKHPDLFPEPFEDPQELAGLRDAFWRARGKAIAAEVAAKQATKEKREALKELVFAMKGVLKDAENKWRRRPEELSKIGWGPRRPDQPLEPPGQVGELEILHEGKDWIALQWKRPADGGKVASYRVMRCRKGGEEEFAGTALETTIVLTNQERAVDWEYWVVAVNRAGSGPESNRVEAVL